MDLREEFKKENGYGVMAVRQDYAGQRPYEDGFCDEYVEWLEAKVKKLSLHNVSQQRELFDAILDFTEDLPMCSEDYNRDTLYKRYIAENCG